MSLHMKVASVLREQGAAGRTRLLAEQAARTLDSLVGPASFSYAATVTLLRGGSEVDFVVFSTYDDGTVDLCEVDPTFAPEMLRGYVFGETYDVHKERVRDPSEPGHDYGDGESIFEDFAPRPGRRPTGGGRIVLLRPDLDDDDDDDDDDADGADDEVQALTQAQAQAQALVRDGDSSALPDDLVGESDSQARLA